MSIASAVNFGKDFIAHIEAAIKKVEEVKNLKGSQKMEQVNELAYKFFDENFDKVKINFLVKGYLKKKIRKAIPSITQKVYDLIATSVEGITNKIKNKTAVIDGCFYVVYITLYGFGCKFCFIQFGLKILPERFKN